jgi:glutamyl-Q tRNA(Asp) synthetase
LGSLVAAVGSYLDAKAHRGEWLVRIEDVDLARNDPNAAGAILRTLERYGFEWDGPVVYQTTRFPRYLEILESLRRAGAVFPCACTRREIGDGRYPGTCRGGVPSDREARAWRLRVDSDPIRFHDRWRGAFSERLTESCGDFVLRRADGCWAYQFAVVVDDSLQEVTHVVRGEDLLDSTARQIFLQRVLRFETPRYLHLPLVRDSTGEKLSKQTLAPPLDDDHPVPALLAAMRFLRLDPPAALALDELWSWARSAWPTETAAVRGSSDTPDYCSTR